MPKVVPSVVVSIIDEFFPQAAKQEDREEKRFSIGRKERNEVTAVVDLVERIPGELFVLDSSDYAVFSAALSAVKSVIKTWETGPDYSISHLGPRSNLNPISIIRQLLAKCPDRSLMHSSSSLKFIRQKDFRNSILMDISGANQALSNGEWKAATVLGGSAIEALLLWSLQKVPKPKIKATASSLTGVFSTPTPTLEKWNLHQMAGVAKELKIIQEETHKQAELAKNFRNLIHPGRAARTGQRCDRSTALTAVAALEAVIRDLTR